MALVMGMDYHTFWHEPPHRIKAYLKKEKMERERREAEYEYSAWLEGSYVYEAVAVVLEHALTKNAKGAYPTKPRETPTEYAKRRKREELQQAIDPQVALFQARFDVWARNFGKNTNQGS